MKTELLAHLSDYGQEHLLAFWDELDEAQRASLSAEIRTIDFDLISRLYARRDAVGDIRALADRAKSPPAFRLEGAQNRFSSDEAKRRGAEALSAGRVGAILVAGGQGTRLGFEHPKGMFPIGPVSENSLFRIHIEKIVATARRYGTNIPLYLMTSPATHDETVEFLAREDRFGLARQDLRIFCQGTMPAVDAQSGKLLLAERHHVALSPDGHGGMLAALSAGGCLKDARRRGIEQLFYFQVDNPLVEVCGPKFLGYHLLAHSEFSTQVVAKCDPLEKVGNVVDVDGRLHVIEYSDLPEDVARRRTADGSPEIWAGSIAVHVMDVSLLERMCDRADALPPHVARKAVPYIDATGQRIQPRHPNAIKFERFIFDLMPLAAGAIVMEVDPARNFAPLKDGPGKQQDTPEMVKARMIAEHTRWLRRAGAEVAAGVAVEISPLFALDAEQLAERIAPGTRVTEATFFC